MLHVSPKNNNENCRFETKNKSLKFLVNLFKRKKNQDDPKERSDEMDRGSAMHQGMNVTRVPSTLSVRDVMMSACPPSPALSTPARNRDINSDMEALRISRHDNPFLKQVLASRESLADSLEESESDDINLMSQEFLSELDTDPLSLPEVHQHMIRSPPPTSWPRSPNFKMFRFPNESENSSQESLGHKSPLSRSVSPRQEASAKQEHSAAQGEESVNTVGSSSSSKSALSLLSPRLTLPSRPHQRSSSDVRERNFTLLTPAPLKSLTDVRRLNARTAEDSQQLVTADKLRN